MPSSTAPVLLLWRGKAHVLNNANLPTKETMEDLADMLGAELIQVIGHYGVLFKKKDKKSHYEFIKD